MPLLNPPRRLRVLALILFAALAANLFYHGAQPYAVGLIPPPWDKLAHLFVFGGFAGLTWVALGGVSLANWLAPLAAVVVGLADEFWQGFHPGRSVDVKDVVADLVGGVLVVLVLAWLRRSVVRRHGLGRASAGPGEPAIR